MALGTLIALATFTLGAAAQLSPAVSRQLPPAGIVLFGGAGTLLVALLYAPTAAAIHQPGRSIGDELFDLRTAPDPTALLDRADQRQRFEQVLGRGSRHR